MYNPLDARGQERTPPFLGFETEFGAHFAAELLGRNDLPPAGMVTCGAHQQCFGGQVGHGGCGRGCGECDALGLLMYPDHTHPEGCTPLCPDALSLLRWQERLLEMAVAVAQYLDGRGIPVRLHTATSNRRGAGWGWHANILIDRTTFDRWRDAAWAPLMRQWVPFLATAAVLLGTGKLGAENARPAARFQLSERADFLTELISLETVEKKAMINTRDEPLADARRFARLHIAGVFSFNRMPFAAWLKFGCLQLMIALLTAGVHELPDLRLADPLAAAETVSRDLALTAHLPMADGTRRTAIEIQEALVHAVARAIADGRIDERLVPDAALLLDHWALTLRQLARRDPTLRRRLDWVARLRGLEHARETLGGCAWSDPRLLEVDLRYGAVNGGWFEQLASAAGLVDRPEDFLPAAVAARRPTTSPRDVARLALIRKFPYPLAAVDWDGVCLTPAGAGSSDVYRIALDDPLDASAVLAAVTTCHTARELIEALSPSHCVPTQCGAQAAEQTVEALAIKENDHERPTAAHTSGYRPA